MPPAPPSSKTKKLKVAAVSPPSSVAWTWSDVKNARPAQRFLASDISAPPLVHPFVASVHDWSGADQPCLIPSTVEPDLAFLRGRVIQKADFDNGAFHAEVRVGHVLRRGLADVWFDSGSKVCLKIVPLVQLSSRSGSGGGSEDTMQELEMMRFLHRDGDAESRSVVRCLEAVKTPEDLVMVLQFFEGGDLFDRLSKQECQRFSERGACHGFCSILRALVFLQKKDVFLRDLSIENIMVHDGHAVIIDLGMAVRVPRHPGTGRRELVASLKRCGKDPCMAPEVWDGAPAIDGFAIDVWAAVTVLFTMLIGDRPFTKPDRTDKWFAMVSDGKFKEMLAMRGVLSPEAADLLERMLVTDPAKRLTSVEDIVASDFVRKHGGHLQFQ